MSTIDSTYDVIIIGGGPAGSTAGTILADAGLKTLILEREKFPRFHIGESLMPETYWTFERIGMLERLGASDFPKKYSVQFISERGKESRPFYFKDHNPHACSTTWQVDRAEFDAMLLDNAREKGADVRMGWTVDRVQFEGPRAVGVEGSRPDGRKFVIKTKVVVDASGLHSILSRQLKIK